MKFHLIIALSSLSVILKEADKPNNYIDQRDGNKYKTVRINGTSWFVDDLRFVTKNSFYQTKQEAYNGNFYSEKEAKKACPDGWRLPRLSDWSDFIKVMEEKNSKHRKHKIKTKSFLEHRTKGYSFFEKKPLELSKDGRVDNKKHIKFGMVDYWIENKKTNSHVHISSSAITIHSHKKGLFINEEPSRLFKVKCVCED